MAMIEVRCPKCGGKVDAHVNEIEEVVQCRECWGSFNLKPVIAFKALLNKIEDLEYKIEALREKLGEL